ncbi:MAG: ECF-type sigma factor [Acidobacteriota bacterium]
MSLDRRQVVRLLEDPETSLEVLDEALPKVYDEMRRLASFLLRGERSHHTLKTTELVHEAYLRLFGWNQETLSDRRKLFSTAAIAMRRVLVEHARRRSAQKRIPPDLQVNLESARQVATSTASEMLALDRALDALAKLNERQARIVELKYFAGLTEPEVAKVLELSRATVARDMRAAKLWLRREMRS